MRVTVYLEFEYKNVKISELFKFLSAQILDVTSHFFIQKSCTAPFNFAHISLSFCIMLIGLCKIWYSFNFDCVNVLHNLIHILSLLVPQFCSQLAVDRYCIVLHFGSQSYQLSYPKNFLSLIFIFCCLFVIISVSCTEFEHCSAVYHVVVIWDYFYSLSNPFPLFRLSVTRVKSPRPDSVWFLPKSNSSINRPGILYGQCSEICGANHRFILIAIERVTTNKFINWISNIKESSGDWKQVMV